MWIVRIALDRPYTFIVLALIILILSPVVILRTPTDIFPNIDIPVIAAAWNYSGLGAEELERRLTSIYERILTTAVERYRTHRVADRERPGHHQDFLPADGRHQRGHGSGERRFEYRPAAAAAGSYPAFPAEL